MPAKLLRWSMAVAVCLLAVLVAIGAAFAQSAAAPVVEIHPLLQWLLGIASAVATAGVPVLLVWLQRRLGLQQDALTQTVMDAAIQRAGGVAYSHLAASASQAADPTIKSAAIARGVQYVLDGAPGAATQLGLTPDRIGAMVAAELGRLLAVDPSVRAGASAIVALPAPVPVAVVGDAPVAPAAAPVSVLALLAGACLLGLTACATPSQTGTVLADAQTAQEVAHAALQVYAAQPNANAALVVRLEDADTAAGAAIEAALAAPADDAAAQAAAAAVAVLVSLSATEK